MGIFRFFTTIATFYLWGVVHQDPSIQMSRKAIRSSGRKRLMSDSGRKSGSRILVKQRGQKDCSEILDPESTYLIVNAATT